MEDLYMKSVKIISLLVALLMLVTALAACSPKMMIKGTWVKQDSVLGIVTETTYVFNEDGTGSMSTVLGIDIPMTYTIDSSKLTVKIDTIDVAEDVLEQLGIDYSIEYSYSIVGNKLTLSDGKKDMVFTKK